MNFTIDQLKQMRGIDTTQIDLDALDRQPSRMLPIIAEVVTDHIADVGKKVGRPPIIKNDKGQNKGEARLDRHLSDLKVAKKIAYHWFEPFNLRLPGRLWFRLDFVVKTLRGNLILIDYKGGPIEDDSLAKLKVCSEVYIELGPTYVCRYVNREHLFFPVLAGRVSDVPHLDWMEL